MQIGRVALDTVAIGAFGTPSTSTHVCIDNNGVFTACASSRRYKENVQPFFQGLPVIKRLRPVTFNWKEGREADLGLIAEEVNTVEPLLNTYNRKGEIEGVKYEQLTIVLVNAVQEQQRQIETQQKQIDKQNAINKKQQAELDMLKALVCSHHRTASGLQTVELIRSREIVMKSLSYSFQLILGLYLLMFERA